MCNGICDCVNDKPAISAEDLQRMVAFDCASLFGAHDAQKDYRNLSEEALERAVVSLLKPNRVRHVLGCRDTAVALAKRWSAGAVDAARAGLLHDITKALNEDLQVTLCKAYGVGMDAFSAQNPKTLHALTGSLVAQRIFGENAAVVSAIASHTTAKANMNTLEKILYVADYMEPNRDFDGVEELRRLAYTDLDAALKMGLEMTICMLRQQGRDISPASIEALAYLNRI